MLTYNVGSISYHSEKGFEFINPNSFSLTPSQIGDTGILIEIHNLKFDFRTDKNIPEATADGRPDSFKGVYVEYAALTLPKKWFNDDEVVGGITAKIAGYNMLIGSGGLSGTIALETQTFRNSNGSIINYYTDYFQFEYPLQTTHKDVSNNLIITNIADYTALETQLTSFDETQFVFPLSLTKNSDSTPTEYTNIVDYYAYLNTCYDASDENNKPRLSKRIGNNGFEAWFTSFDMTFKQGSIVNSNIQCGLKIPKLKDSQGNDAEIDIFGHLYENGDFNITASEPDGIPLNLFNFVQFNFLTLELGKQEDNFFIGTSCEISFENEIMKRLLGEEKISIPKLRVYDDGSMEIVGGNAFIPTNISLNLGPVEIAVTGIHFGSYQQEHNGHIRKYNYWGFDGAISIDPLGVDARGEGIKYYYTTDNDEMVAEFGGVEDDYKDNFLRIQTIEVDLIIPGSASPDSAMAIIHGMVSIPEPGESQEYIGEVGLKLPKANVSGYAKMRLMPKEPAFLIEAGIEMPNPIPLAATGLAFYGFGGLLGFKYVAEKEAIGLVSGEDTWYDYYTYPKRGVGQEKFSGPPQTDDYNFPVAIGAGAVIGTMADDGYTFSTRLMIILSLPSVFILDGRANLLDDRLDMMGTTEPPFFAGVAIGDASVEFWFGADYQLPKDNGWILDLQAEVQAGYFKNNPSGWYVNFGTKQDPITAKVLTIVTAQTYLMLSAQGIEAGARVEFNLDKKFGPVRVKIYAYFEMGGYISFEKPQIGGYIALGGEILVKFWIVKLTIRLDALLSVEAAKPFLLYAEFRVKACIKVWRWKKCKSIKVKLKWTKDGTLDRSPIPALPNGGPSNDQLDRREELVQGVHMLTNEIFAIDMLTSAPNNSSSITKVIPLDTFIDIKLVKGVIPNAITNIGGLTHAPKNYTDLVPPKKVVRGGREIRQVKHKYAIKELTIYYWDETTTEWKEYHPYKAVIEEPVVGEPGNTVNTNDLKIGYWQKSGKQYDAIRLLATTPFSYIEAGEPGWFVPEQYGITASSLFCESTNLEGNCSNVLNKPIGTIYYPPTQYIGHQIDGAYYTLEGDSYLVVNTNNGLQNSVNTQNNFVVAADTHPDFDRSIQFNNRHALVVILPEASVRTKLHISTLATGVTIEYYSSEFIAPGNTDYNIIHSQYIAAAALGQPVGFSTIDEENNNVLYGASISKIIIRPDSLSATNCGSIDTILCSFYNDLLALYNNCLPESFDNFGDCEHEFYALFKSFNSSYPEYNLSSTTNGLESQFRLVLGSSGENQLTAYDDLRYSVNSFLTTINELGNCDCEEEVDLTTSLQTACWVTIEHHEYNINIPSQQEIVEDYELMTQGLQATAQPIWRPNTAYYVHFQLEDDVDNGANVVPFDYYYGFKTAGPIGHFHNAINVDYGNEYIDGALINRNADGKLTNPDSYALTSLRHYIDYNRSYPNASGNLLKAKPIFYGHKQCKITLFFIKPYAVHMLNTWFEYGNDEFKGELSIMIKDPVSNVAIPYPLPENYDETVPEPTDADWIDDENPLEPLNLQIINNFIDNVSNNNTFTTCVMDLGEGISPPNPMYSVELTNLKPQKLYSALIYNVFDKNSSGTLGEDEIIKVHDFVFQTSRYADFRVQVESFNLIELNELGETVAEREAIFNIPLDLDTAKINAAYNLIKDGVDVNSLALETQYNHLFDRVVEGVLGLKPINPAICTEFNLLKNQNTGNIIGLLIRNPEPFNNPKIPIEDIEETIKVMLDETQFDENYHVLHSLDYSQIIIMNDAKHISVLELAIKFQYKTWNGIEYIVEDEDDIPDNEKKNVLTINLQINS